MHTLLIVATWTALNFFVGLPLWMIFTRRNRRYHRANNWADDFQFDEGQHPHVERAGLADEIPSLTSRRAIHQVAS